MESLGVSGRVARSSARHPWPVIGAWIVAIALGSVAWRSIDRVIAPGSELFLGIDSERGSDLMSARLQGTRVETDVICSSGRIGATPSGDTAASDDGHAARAAIAGAARCYNAREPDLAAYGPYAPSPVVEHEAALTRITLNGTPAEAARQAWRALETAVAVRTARSEPMVPIGARIEETLRDTADADLARADRIGIPIAFLVLVHVSRSLVASLIPLALGLAAVTVTIGVVFLIGTIVDLPFIVTNVVAMIGFAVGIDYALLITERYREERRRGHQPRAAIEKAGATAGQTVTSSGTVVVAALAGLLLIPIAVFRGVAVAGIAVVAVGVLGAATLLPATLAVAGDFIDWPCRMGLGGRPGGPSHRSAWLATVVMRRPLVAVVLVATVLVPLGVQCFDLRLGISTLGMDTSASRPLVRPLAADLATALQSVVEIVVAGPRSQETEQRITDVVATLGQDRDFAPLVAVQRTDTGDLAVISVLVAWDPSAPEGLAAVDRLQRDILPRAFADLPVEVLLVGVPATRAEAIRAIEDWQPRVLAVVLALSCLLLLLIFRSVVIPLVAALLNLASVAAATGLLVLVFQKGVGVEQLGFQRTPLIDAWVPVFLFCLLFGLSMDYHIFLLSRIRENYVRTGDNTASVTAGLLATRSIISASAAIMVVVFGAFAAGDLVVFQQLGFGLAAAIFLDATLVRSVLVPACMALLGDRSWYLPRWLAWLPNAGTERTQASVLSTGPVAFPPQPLNSPGGVD